MNHTEWSVFYKVLQKMSLAWGFPIRQEILNVFVDKYDIPWNLPTNFHPDLIVTIRQRCLPLLCALLPLSNPICFWSVWCRRTMIPRKMFMGFAKFQRSVSVNDFRLPIWLQELLQAPLCFLRSFCFARIRLNSLGGQVLHHDCISMIVSRITPFAKNFVICCNQITKNFCTRYDSANASVFCTGLLSFWSSARSRNFCLLRSEYKLSVNIIHTSRRLTL